MAATADESETDGSDGGGVELQIDANDGDELTSAANGTVCAPVAVESDDDDDEEERAGGELDMWVAPLGGEGVGVSCLYMQLSPRAH